VIEGQPLGKPPEPEGKLLLSEPLQSYSQLGEKSRFKKKKRGETDKGADPQLKEEKKHKGKWSRLWDRWSGRRGGDVGGVLISRGVHGRASRKMEKKRPKKGGGDASYPKAKSTKRKG